MSKVLTLDAFDQDITARQIACMFDAWTNDKQVYIDRHQEIRDYLYCSDMSIAAKTDKYRNNVRIPKMTQVYDNLLANYTKALFPNDRWFRFVANSLESASLEKKRALEAYVGTKLHQMRSGRVFRKLITDWIDYGNCFAELTFVDNTQEIEGESKKRHGYIGPQLTRISPLDVVFDLSAKSFTDSPKIVRTLKTLGQLARAAETESDEVYTTSLVDDVMNKRHMLGNYGGDLRNFADQARKNALIADGFDSLEQYYNSQMVEILDFRGDWFDRDNNKLHRNARIVVVDRRKAYIVENNSWRDSGYLYHTSWRERPDNLWGQSPLELLVGMQHRIDHIENVKSDVLDMIAFPTAVERGEVTYFDADGNENGVRGQLGGYYKIDSDGSVNYLVPDTTMLQADLLLENYQRWMEEFAGAPKLAMGIRSPGEKTAFEVQTLSEGANSIFDHKAEHFQETFLEPILSDFVELGRRLLEGRDVVTIKDDRLGIDKFLNITREDLEADGTFKAMGARYYKRANRIAGTLQAIFNSPMAEVIQRHIDPMKLAKLIENAAGLDEFDLARQDAGTADSLNTTRLQEQGRQQIADELLADLPDDIE